MGRIHAGRIHINIRRILPIVAVTMILLFLVTTLQITAPYRNPPHESKEFHPCYSVFKVFGHDDIITVYFNKNISSKYQNTIHQYFGYETTAFSRPLIIPYNATTFINKTERSVTLQLTLPFVQNYDGSVFCVNPDFFKEESLLKTSSILNKVDNIFEYHTKKSNFSKHNYSQLQCFGDSYETRFCEMRNVGLYNSILVFYSPVLYHFPDPFLSIGARAPPFCRVNSMLNFEPVVIKRPLSQLPGMQKHESTLSYLIARFHNSLMIWHMLYDFIIPAYSTFDMFEKDSYVQNRQIFIRDDEFSCYDDFINLLSEKPINYIDKNNPVTISFDRLIVGLRKFETNPTAARIPADMLRINYMFNKETAPRFRDEAMRRLKINTTIDPLSPKVIIIERKKQKRYFVNPEEVEQYIRQTCDFCDVQRVDFAEYSQAEQVRIASSASVLIGIHGSGLGHVIWMPPSGNGTRALIEILPPGYVCRDWFAKAAEIARVDYYSIFGRVYNSTEPVRQRCLDNPDICATIGCHDYLRDKNLTLDVGEFTGIWTKIAQNLEKEYDSV